MIYPVWLIELSKALAVNNGAKISYLLSISGPGAEELRKDLTETGRLSLLRYKDAIASPWDEVGPAHVQAILRYAENNYVDAYTEQATMVKAFLRAFTGLQAWVLPALFTILKDLRDVAEKADDVRFQQGNSVGGSLEDAARLCNKAFTDCVMDRATGPESRKWGIYHVVGLIFKCYFSVNRIALSRNIIRALSANKDIPPLEQYPRADQASSSPSSWISLSFLSVLRASLLIFAFLFQSERELTSAFNLCYAQSKRNLELILNYLIPLRLLRGQLPAPALLQLFPRLEELYTPFIKALRSGDVKAYDAALEWAETRLVEMGVYLAVEKAREICLRCLFRKVWAILEKPTRIQISQFHAAFEASGLSMPIDETECVLANMIFKGYIRGYISHERQTVVLAKGAGAFPKLSDRKM
ncbi:COP9 signalosome (CSN) subunit [Tulasnella sp. 403]|nr:COP9 signalosome (CSN) subunit [Tulasnella sp. 403]